MATIYEKVEERIKKLRKDAGLSQEQLATESKLETGDVWDIPAFLRQKN